jgi:hypothetical protein
MRDVQDLPEQFDFDQEVINIQFALMLKLARNYDKRLIMEEKRLRAELHHYFGDSKYVDKMYNRVYLQAYHTIPGEFWKNIKKPSEN